MSSRIEVRLSPSLLAGVLASLPWLILTVFLVIAAMAGKAGLLLAMPVSLAGATLQFRSNGLLLGARSVRSLRVDQGQMYATTGNNQETEVLPAASSRLGAGLTVLKLRPNDSRFRAYSTILLSPTSGSPGNVPEDEFRRLRVWLRLGHCRRPSI